MLSHQTGKTNDGSMARRRAPHGVVRTLITWWRGRFGRVGSELRAHVPFTIVGTLTGLAIMGLLVAIRVPRPVSVGIFWSLHPLHVFLSALVTAGMYRLHGGGRLWATIAIGYVGSIGIATLSDCIIPYIGETLMGLPNREIHFGVVEKWWLVNPLAGLGIGVACLWPTTEFFHAGHVLLSTWASLFHLTMAFGESISPVDFILLPLFLFLAVWIPCCTSDIVFPLLFAKDVR